jgi:hypothetical protein
MIASNAKQLIFFMMQFHGPNEGAESGVPSLQGLASKFTLRPAPGMN